MRISEAIHHEETPSHRAFIKDTNGLPPPPSSPAHKSSPTQIASDLPADDRQSSLPPSSPPIYPDDDIPEISTMPGPFLPGDGLDLIYDDYSGAWGMTMPRLDDDLDQRRTYDTGFQEDNHTGQDLEELDEEEFKGGYGNAEVEYFRSLHEAEDFTEAGGLHSSDPNDWWPQSQSMCFDLNAV